MYTTHTGGATFEEVLSDIAGTRSTYELLRVTNGSFDERARLLTRLHTLRALAAELRATL